MTRKDRTEGIYSRREVLDESERRQYCLIQLKDLLSYAYRYSEDLTNPDVVKLDLQETGYTSYYKNHDRPTNIINQGAYLTLYAAEGEDPLTDDEVVKQGVNDLYKDGVIDIKHPIYYLPADESQNVKEAMFTIKDAYVKLVMPTEETGQTSYATNGFNNGIAL